MGPVIASSLDVSVVVLLCVDCCREKVTPAQTDPTQLGKKKNCTLKTCRQNLREEEIENICLDNKILN